MQGFQVGKGKAVINTRWNLNTGIVQLQRSRRQSERSSMCVCACELGVVECVVGSALGGGGGTPLTSESMNIHDTLALRFSIIYLLITL